jgi:hypothetical protein
MVTFCLVGLIAASAQSQEDETTRRLWDTAFIKKGKKAATKKPAKRSYRIATPNVPTVGVSADTVIGVTVWRLRPAKAIDSSERILTHESNESSEWIPERIAADAKLKEGDRVRLSIEAARAGYLYVIDQEQYADGSLSEPYLIFPTTRMRDGDNNVKQGRIIEIPSQEDSPPFFTLRRSRADQTGEILSVLVTTEPLEAVEIGREPIKLSNQIFAAWEKSWGAGVGRLEMENGAGKSWTSQEKEAGADPKRLLKADEPAPQSLYYRPKAKTGEPIVAELKLQYGRIVSTTGSRRR